MAHVVEAKRRQSRAAQRPAQDVPQQLVRSAGSLCSKKAA
jgi:hypothetical protein